MLPTYQSVVTSIISIVGSECELPMVYSGLINGRLSFNQSCSDVRFSQTDLNHILYFKLVYARLISLTLSVQDTKSSHSYTIDSELRLSLYQCLTSTVYSCNAEVGPLTHITSQLLSKGLQDKCSQVTANISINVDNPIKRCRIYFLLLWCIKCI